MPKWDGLKPRPDHVIASLLRALACIPRTADARLLLRNVDSGWRPARVNGTRGAGLWSAVQVALERRPANRVACQVSDGPSYR